MKYETPAALEMAIREAARKSQIDTSRAIDGFYFDRLLCRIFSEEESSFVLKGGQSMIARTLSARTTRDIDLVSTAVDVNEAVNDLRRLAAIDLKDFVEFIYVGTSEIKTEDEYREGYRVTFTPYLGTSRKPDVSVDLVVDNVICEQPEVVCPKGRLCIDGLTTYDYLLYPVVQGISDKICATMQLYNGVESSRVKDLVDLAVYITTESFVANDLKKQANAEAHYRKMESIMQFKIPSSWVTTYRLHYEKLAKETSLDNKYHNVNDAYILVSDCLNPVFDDSAKDRTWNCFTQKWELS